MIKRGLNPPQQLPPKSADYGMDDLLREMSYDDDEEDEDFEGSTSSYIELLKMKHGKKPPPGHLEPKTLI